MATEYERPAFLPRSQDFGVLVGAAAVEEMLVHAREGFPLEIGGHLLGYRLVDTDNNRVVTYIDRAMRAETDSTHTHVLFLPTNIGRIQEVCEREKLQIVGYYHSHPGFGVFQSGEDVQNYRLYYNEPHQIATVIDPTKAGSGKVVRSHWLGFFGWRDGLAPYLLDDSQVRVVDKQTPETAENEDRGSLSAPERSSSTSILKRIQPKLRRP